MSVKSKGPASPPEGQASKAKVKEQIKIIVDDLELVLGDLKDVAKELKEVSADGVRVIIYYGLSTYKWGFHKLIEERFSG
ncbi:hypothetical protein FKM82_029295 [Ascaphus truei]